MESSRRSCLLAANLSDSIGSRNIAIISVAPVNALELMMHSLTVSGAMDGVKSLDGKRFKMKIASAYVRHTHQLGG